MPWPLTLLVANNVSRSAVLRRANGVVVGRIFCLDAVAPPDRPWMWASGHNGDYRRAAHGYEPTRESAMQAFARSWHRET
jgi:hypothetical protein